MHGFLDLLDYEMTIPSLLRGLIKDEDVDTTMIGNLERIRHKYLAARSAELQSSTPSKS